MSTLATEPLTVRQREVLEFYLDYLVREGFPPSYRETMTRLGVASGNGIIGHWNALARKGYIEQRGPRRHPRILRWPDGEPFRGLARPGLESVTTPEESRR